MDEERYVSSWLEAPDGYRRVPLIGRRATVERFRPWYERWFTRLDGRWQPFLKWDTNPVFSGTVGDFTLDPDLLYTVTLQSPRPDQSPPTRD